MRFLAISQTTPAATPTEVEQAMDEEVAYGKQLFTRGFLIEGYMNPTYTTAYMVCEAPTQADAETTLAQYPLIQRGLNTYDVIPLVGVPAIAYVLQEQQQPLPSWWPASAQ